MSYTPKTLLLLTCLFIVGSLSQIQGQDLRTALKKLQHTYQGKEQMHIKMQVSAYENATADKAFYEQTVEVKRQDQQYHYIYPGNEMLLSGDLLLLVNNQQKLITCQQRSQMEQENVPENPLQNLDTLMKHYQKETYLGKRQGYDHYRLEQQGSPIQTVELLLDPATGLVHQMAYHYKAGQYVTIDFVVFDLNPMFDKQTFATSRYIKGKASSRHPIGAYQDYQVIQ